MIILTRMRSVIRHGELMTVDKFSYISKKMCGTICNRISFFQEMTMIPSRIIRLSISCNVYEKMNCSCNSKSSGCYVSSCSFLQLIYTYMKLVSTSVLFSVQENLRELHSIGSKSADKLHSIRLFILSYR